MLSLWSFLLMVHLIGLALGVGSATTKVVLLVKCRRDVTFIPSYLKLMKPITQLLVFGLILMTLTGITWLILGYGLPKIMIVKLVFVGVVWVLGLMIDNLTEPRFRQLAPKNGEAATPEFIQIQKKHFALEVTATLIFYIIIVLGVLL